MPRGIGREESAAVSVRSAATGSFTINAVSVKAGGGMRGAFSAEWPPFQTHFLSSFQS